MENGDFKDVDGDTLAKEYYTMDDLPLNNKTVLMRVDINSTIDLKNKEIKGRERFRQLLPSIRLTEESRLVLLAHQSRAGLPDCIKLDLHRGVLEEEIGREVIYVEDLIGAESRRAVENLGNGEILLLENTRLYAEENAFGNRPPHLTKNTYIVRNLAPLCDYFVFDAFAASHRSQPSLNGFMELLPSAAGKLMEKEITALDGIITGERKPMGVVLGGVKIDDSVEIARNLLSSGKADKLFVTGLVANLFLAANKMDIGKKNFDILKSKVNDLEKYVEMARSLIYKYPYQIFMPDDIAVEDGGKRNEIFIDMLPTEKPIKDLGTNTIEFYCDEISQCSSIMLNGPAGVFENEEFSFGTRRIFETAASRDIFSVMGGGETTTVIDQYDLRNGIDHISTGGGACLNYLAGKEMPVLKSLALNKKKFKI